MLNQEVQKRKASFFFFHCELDGIFYFVQMCQEFGQLWSLRMITKVSSTYLFHKRGGSVKVSRARASMSSMTKFATTDETGQPIAVPKTCLQCFPRNVKLVEYKQISRPLIRSLVDKPLCWVRAGSDWRRCLATFNAIWIGTFVNKDTTSNETIISWVIEDAKSENFLRDILIFR